MCIRDSCDERQNVVIGVKDQSYYDHVPPLRRSISRVFRFFVRSLLRIPTDDTQCGLKGFDQVGKAVFLKTTIDRYLFDLEFVFLASDVYKRQVHSSLLVKFAHIKSNHPFVYLPSSSERGQGEVKLR